ncbi:MAG: hypothetical protein HC817_16535 [Saprospiraceae bacterium]|nr:hypothetical protein [Saprospiraceae bacterium]
MLNGVNLYMEREQMSLMDWELLLEVGWDRVSTHFFHRRFDHFQLSEDMFGVIQLMPLRYKLNDDFRWSKSQRNIFKRNSDLTYLYRPAVIDDEKRALFDRWYEKRFRVALLSNRGFRLKAYLLQATK